MEHRYQSRLKTDPTSTFQPAHNTHVQNPLKTMRREKKQGHGQVFLNRTNFLTPSRSKTNSESSGLNNRCVLYEGNCNIL